MNIEDKIKKGQEEFLQAGGNWEDKLGELGNRLDLSNNKSEKIKRKFKWIWLVLVSLVVLAIYFLNSWQKNTTEDLFIAFYEPAPALFESNERSENTNGNKPSRKLLGNQAYINQDYELAFNYWSKAQEEAPSDLETRTFLGICALHLNQPESAMNYLKDIKSGEYHDVAIWYLALTQLKTENDQASIRTLKTIIQNKEHYKLGDAQALLEQLVQ